MRKLLAAALLFAVPAFAHEAPTGWTYGLECCSNKDCWQEKEGAITETPNGYKVVLTNELILYNDKRIKKSKDEFFHRCTLSGDPNAGRSLCLYVPNKGY
ncbi:hypothetical protein LJR231_003443 [Phyllobacterium sp. LjRoot231]|uniref:hypothetical protein n=1 Tax=Phyllobacterium sp. LjRoot231 TaxID=3342289 RepID=UPI003ED09AFA